MSSIKTINEELADAKERTRVEEPAMFEVLLHNDDYTTMDFVITVLQTIFQKSEVLAMEIMFNVHNNGVGVAGIYPREIAETKVAIVHDRAHQEGHPLRCTIKKV